MDRPSIFCTDLPYHAQDCLLTVSTDVPCFPFPAVASISPDCKVLRSLRLRSANAIYGWSVCPSCLCVECLCWCNCFALHSLVACFHLSMSQLCGLLLVAFCELSCICILLQRLAFSGLWDWYIMLLGSDHIDVICRSVLWASNVKDCSGEHIFMHWGLLWCMLLYWQIWSSKTFVIIQSFKV